MSSSEVKIKIGCDGLQNKQDYEPIELAITLQQSKLKQYSKIIHKDLSVNRTPFLTIQLNDSSQNQYPQFIQLFGYEIQMKEKVLANKRIIFGDIKNQEQALFLKKIQRVFHSLTQLNTSATLKVDFYQPKQFLNKQKLELGDLLQRLKVKGSLKMDEKTVQVLKKALIKVSPKFTQSPIFLFFELFVALDFKLEIQSLNNLEESSRQNLLNTLFVSKSHNDKFSQFLRTFGDKPTKINVCLQNLFKLSISGPAQLLSLIIILNLYQNLLSFLLI